MSKYILFFTVLILFVSCKQEKEMPKVRYDKTAKEKVQAVEDTSVLAVADLPIHFDGVNFLIHPIGSVTTGDRSRAYDAASSRNNPSFTVSNTNDFQITGFLTNLKFQAVNSDSLKVLSEKPIVIETATYLKTFADKNKLQFMVYTLSDSDTNKDGKLDRNDIQSLYISTADGSNFNKISSDLSELIDWNVIDATGKLYFRSIDDSNKNGAFDKDDKIHYHFVNLLSKDLKVLEYNPI